MNGEERRQDLIKSLDKLYDLTKTYAPDSEKTEETREADENLLIALENLSNVLRKT